VKTDCLRVLDCLVPWYLGSWYVRTVSIRLNEDLPWLYSANHGAGREPGKAE
jgi:hypothetical protein